MPEDRPTSPRKARRLLSVPLSPEQMGELSHRAGGKPVSAYARDVLFAANDNAAPRRARKHDDRSALAAALLAQLGKGEAASSLREIARGVQLGIIVMTPETDAALRATAESVNAAAQGAMRLLGIKPR